MRWWGHSELATTVSAPPAQLAYLALRVRDPKATADWYSALTGFRPAGADASGTIELEPPRGDAGEGTRLLLRPGTPADAGMKAASELLTVAFTVRDIQSTAAAARSIGANVTKGPDKRHLWLTDPTGYVVHLVGPSDPGAAVTPGWRYVGLRVDDLPAAQDFYVNRFGFQVLPEKTGDDGTAMARVAPSDPAFARFSLQYYPARPPRPNVPEGLFSVGIRTAGQTEAGQILCDPAGYSVEQV
jgi:catechol 2,3-dioxygenase-like lactoylglutathione lyase family enzyme